jgi:hypothetical protein
MLGAMGQPLLPEWALQMSGNGQHGTDEVETADEIKERKKLEKAEYGRKSSKWTRLNNHPERSLPLNLHGYCI